MIERAAGTARRWRRARWLALIGLCAVAWAQPVWALATFERKLVPSSAASRDFVGSSVAISGDTVLLGEPYRDDQGADSGAVWVFTRAPGTTIWTQQAKLMPADGSESDWFGWSVAISGDTAAIGAPGRQCGAGEGCGAVYTFERSGGEWSEGPMLLGAAGSIDQDAWFGASVAIREHYLIAGSPYSPPEGAGSADVFSRGVNFSWQHEAHLAAFDAARLDAFGWSVGIDFSSDRSRVRAVVGCLRNDKAYIFETAGQGPWPEVAKLLRDDPPVDQGFGRSVSISGETVLVGAYSSLVNDAPSGAYVFTRSEAGSWLREDRLTPSDHPYGGYGFGYSVALSGDTAIVGSPNLSGGESAAFIYQRGPAGWNETDQLLSHGDWTNQGEFGRVVAMDDETGVITAPKDTSLTGAGYVYAIPAPEPSSLLLQAVALCALATMGRRLKPV